MPAPYGFLLHFIMDPNMCMYVWLFKVTISTGTFGQLWFRLTFIFYRYAAWFEIWLDNLWVIHHLSSFTLFVGILFSVRVSWQISKKNIVKEYV